LQFAHDDAGIEELMPQVPMLAAVLPR